MCMHALIERYFYAVAQRDLHGSVPSMIHWLDWIGLGQWFLPHDATQSAVMRLHVVRLSVRL